MIKLMRMVGLGPKKEKALMKALQETVEKSMSLDLPEERGHFLDRVMKAKSSRHTVKLAMETSHR